MIKSVAFMVVAPVLGAFLSRARGNPKSKITKGLALVAFGAVIAATFLPWVHSSILAGVIITAGLALGCSLGLGNAVGPAMSGTPPDFNKTEWWQVGPLADNAWLSLFVLGFLRAAVCLGAFFHVPDVTLLVAASTVATPLAVFLAIKTLGGEIQTHHQAPGLAWQLETARSNKMWARQEYIYGFLMGAAAWAMS